MTHEISINGRKIGPNHPPYIIAEMSANHNGKIENAFKIIEMAKRCGADAVKIQTYTADTITLDCDKPEFMIQGGLWDGKRLYDLYQEASLPWDWHSALFAKAKEVGITLFSSPFDFTAVELLEDLNAPAYKIASFEAIDLPLIKKVAQTGKPVIISTGMADAEEIQHAIDTATDAGCQELVILHCVSGYPAPPEDYNLATLANMQERFGQLCGLSDHTISNTTAIASVVLGACVIEKHVTLDRNGGGPDDSFSLEEAELKALCTDAKAAWQALGKVDYGRKSSEQGNAIFRRSLYVVEDVKAGTVLNETHVKSIRPGYGLAPKHYEAVLGKVAVEDIERGTPLSWELIK